MALQVERVAMFVVLSIIILGGMGSIPGVVVGSLALIGLPELLREFAEFKLLVYGGVLVVMMIARPASRSACATQFRIACAVGSNSFARLSGLRPDRTSSIICRRNSGV